MGKRAMHHGRAKLRLKVIANQRQARVSEFLGPSRVRGKENRDTCLLCASGPQSAVSIEFHSVMRADRQEDNQHFGLGSL